MLKRLVRALAIVCIVGCSSGDESGRGDSAVPDASQGDARRVDAKPDAPPSDSSLPSDAARDTDVSDSTVGRPTLDLPSMPLPYLFVGANHHRIYTQHDLPDADGVAVNAKAQIQALRAAGFRTLRIFLHQEAGVPWEQPPVAYTFEDPIGTYHDDKLEWIDRLMPDLLGDPDDPFDDIKLIVTLFNFLKGTDQGDIDEDLYFARFGEVGFYTEAAAHQAFKDRITHVLNHRNMELDGVAWKDLDVIAAWEPMNQPGLHTRGDATQTTPQQLAAWLEIMATHIKSVDADGTLVSSGTAGQSVYWPHDVGDHLPTLLGAAGSAGIPNVDIYTLHFYGADPRTWIDDARAALPPGSRLWVGEFGDTRTTTYPRTYDRTAGGVLQRLEQARVPCLFWRLGIRKEGNSWARFHTDGDWNALKESAALTTRLLVDFDTAPLGQITRNIGDPVVFTRVTTDRGMGLHRVFDDDYEDLLYTHPTPLNVSGSAITFRAKASTPVRVEVQIKDVDFAYSLDNPFIQLSTEWQVFQLPVHAFGTGSGFDATKWNQLAFFFKEGSAAGVEFTLDDVWSW